MRLIYCTENFRVTKPFPPRLFIYSEFPKRMSIGEAIPHCFEVGMRLFGKIRELFHNTPNAKVTGAAPEKG